MHNLNLIMRKRQTNSRIGTFCRITALYLSKIKVMKQTEKLSRLKETKDK